jgi:hypothetical protein
MIFACKPQGLKLSLVTITDRRPKGLRHPNSKSMPVADLKIAPN